jgi:hypothetical protein
MIVPPDMIVADKREPCALIVPDTVTALAVPPDETVMVAPLSAVSLVARPPLLTINVSPGRRVMPLTGFPADAT